MRNEKPCRHCREIRRKCVWKHGESSCERCSKADIDCIPFSTKDANISIKDDNQLLTELWDQVLHLEEALNFTKHRIMHSQRQTLSTTNTLISPTSTTVATNRGEPQWNLSITQGGQLRLESNIKNFEELLQYHQASIRYLSPLAGLFKRKGESVIFEGSTSFSAVASSADLLLRRNLTKERRQPLSIPYSPLHTTTNYRAEIDQLVTMYMERCNPSIGMLHAPSFMGYYRQLKDPENSPIILATCVDAIAYLYPQLIAYSPFEKRQWGEFFYMRSRDLLFELYDVPERRLEVVMTTSLLVQFLQDMVMYCSEVRRLVTVALLICSDLLEEEEQEKDIMSSSPCTTNSSNSKNNMLHVERVLLERHYMYLQLSDHLLDVYLEGKVNFSGIQPCSSELLEGESNEIGYYLASWKCIFSLIGSPYISKLLEHIGRTLYGDSCEISLDMIMQFEPMLREWWKSSNVPDEFRICDDPFSPNQVKQVLDKINTPTILVPFAALHCLCGAIQASMLNPRISRNKEDDDDDHNPAAEAAADNMIRIIREKAISLTLTSIRILVYIIKRNLGINSKEIPLSFGYMMGALHAVCNVVNQSTDINLPFEVLEILSKCFNQINTALCLDEHQLRPTSPSPLESFMATQNHNAIDIYESSIFPGYAMTSDVFFTCFHQLERKFHVVF